VSPPSGGQLVVSDDRGEALKTEFIIEAPGWLAWDESSDLEFQFFYLDTQGKNVGLRQKSTDNKITTVLPQTEMVVVRVYDRAGGYTEASQRMVITFPDVIEFIITDDVNPP